GGVGEAAGGAVGCSPARRGSARSPAARSAGPDFSAPLHRLRRARRRRRSRSPQPAPANAAFALLPSWLASPARAGGGVVQYQRDEHPALEAHEITGIADLHAIGVDGPRRRLHLDRLVLDSMAAANV